MKDPEKLHAIVINTLPKVQARNGGQAVKDEVAIQVLYCNLAQLVVSIGPFKEVHDDLNGEHDVDNVLNLHGHRVAHVTVVEDPDVGSYNKRVNDDECDAEVPHEAEVASGVYQVPFDYLPFVAIVVLGVLLLVDFIVDLVHLNLVQLLLLSVLFSEFLVILPGQKPQVAYSFLCGLLLLRHAIEISLIEPFSKFVLGCGLDADEAFDLGADVFRFYLLLDLLEVAVLDDSDLELGLLFELIFGFVPLPRCYLLLVSLNFIHVLLPELHL